MAIKAPFLQCIKISKRTLDIMEKLMLKPVRMCHFTILSGKNQDFYQKIMKWNQYSELGMTVRGRKEARGCDVIRSSKF